MREGWIYEDDAQEINDLIYDVKALPIATILMNYGVKIERRSGHNALALCPFHMDNKIGSFSINIEKNTCFCYSCNRGGNVIKAVSMILGKSYTETALQIACDEGLIDEQKFKTLSNVDYQPKIQNRDESIVFKRESEAEITVSKKTLLYNDVYSAFFKACSLSNYHYEQLSNVRKLSDERIKSDYFTMPKSIRDTVTKMKEFLNGKYTDEEIASVPGFYLDREGDPQKWELVFLNYSGIGILLRDTNGYIRAIQIRSDSNYGPRYIFFSGKMSGSSTVKGGESVGTVIDYLPATKPSAKLAITEGRFKSEILSQNGYNALSVQGVNNYRGMVPMIKAIGSSRVDIFYDADLIKNPQVCTALCGLIRYLKNGLTKTQINVIIWEYKDGKGIDDLIINGKKDICKKFAANDLLTVIDKTLEEAITECGFDKNAPASSFCKADRNLILEMFEDIMRKRLGLNSHQDAMNSSYFE